MIGSIKLLRLLTLGTAIVLSVGAAQVATSTHVWADDKDDRDGNGGGQPNDDLRVYLDRRLHPTAEDPCTPGNIWQGSGNPNNTFQRKRNVDAGIELGLKAIFRGGADIRSTYVDGDGLVHIEVPAGSQPGTTNRSAFNFTYSYNVELDPNNPPLDQYNVELWVDVDPSKNVRYFKSKLVRLAPTPPPACPRDPDLNGYGFKSGSTFVTADEEGTARVTQNSQNLGFSSFLSRIDGDPNTRGIQPFTFAAGSEFDIVLLIDKKGGKSHRDEEDNDDDDDDEDGGKGKGRDSAILHVVLNLVDPPGTQTP